LPATVKAFFNRLVEEASFSNKSELDMTPKYFQRFAILFVHYSIFAEDNESATANLKRSDLLGTSRLSNTIVLPNKAINRLVEEARGMTCDSEGKLIEIRMSDMGLDGELPTELEYLPDLKYLDLSNNDMKGTIPGEIYGLKELRGSTCTIISSQEPSQRQKVSTQVDDESQEKKQDSANPFASGVD
jgi:Leucine-rich repeat (LRR) protein